MFRRLVNAVEVLALVAIACVVVLLFANEPDPRSSSNTPATAGAGVFAANCAGCHGADGGGGTGPQLADGAAAERFPDVDDEIAFVTDGSGGMPSFGGRLTPAQIREVVEHTRTL